MSILIDKSTRLIVQGITGRDGLFHAKKMKEYGTHVVGGTSPGKGGTDVDGICHYGGSRCGHPVNCLYCGRNPHAGCN